MTDRTDDPAAHLRRVLAAGFDTLRWKLDGLAEYELRRPLVPTGTNLLGLAKHVALVSGEYFGLVFDRPSALPAPPEDEPNADMWATADESASFVLDLLATAKVEAEATLLELPLDAPGFVPWWGPDGGHVTLLEVTVHLIAEINRHVGHADIVRELIDGSVGLRTGVSNVPSSDDGVDETWWREYRARLEALAESFR